MKTTAIRLRCRKEYKKAEFDTHEEARRWLRNETRFSWQTEYGERYELRREDGLVETFDYLDAEYGVI